MERTLVLIKPDAVQRELIGEIITRIERKGLKIVGLKMLQMSDDMATDHYKHLEHLPFFNEIKKFMRTTPVIALCVEGVDCVETIRRLTGVTLAREAEIGTIRGELAMSIQCNLVHTSDSIESAKTEIERFFKNDEIFDFHKLLDVVIYSTREATL